MSQDDTNFQWDDEDDTVGQEAGSDVEQESPAPSTPSDPPPARTWTVSEEGDVRPQVESEQVVSSEDGFQYEDDEKVEEQPQADPPRSTLPPPPAPPNPTRESSTPILETRSPSALRSRREMGKRQEPSGGRR